MASVTLTTYEVQIRKKGKRDSLEPFGDYNNGKNFQSFILDVLDKWSLTEEQIALATGRENAPEELVDDQDSKKRLIVDKSHTRAFGSKVEGVIETGEYGIESKVVNQSGKTTKTLYSNESPLVPFYFLGHFPNDEVAGVIMFQKLGKKSGFSIFKKFLVGAFEEENPGYTITIQPLISKELLDEFLNKGAIKYLSLLNKTQTETIHREDGQPSETLYADDYYTEYKLISRRGEGLSIYDRVKSFLSGTPDFKGLIPFNYEYDEVKVNFEVDNTVRTIRLKQDSGLHAVFDVSEEVVVDKITGHPDLVDLKKSGDKLMTDVLKYMGN